MATAARPTVSVICVPTSTRQKMSRPWMSVPNQCCAEGPSNDSLRFCAYGSYGSTCGKNFVTSAMTPEVG